MPKVILQRKKAFLFCLRAFKVMVDGRKIAKVNNGQQVVLDLEPGVHEISLKMDWSSSKKLGFTITDGEEIYFICEPLLFGLQLKPADGSQADQLQTIGSGLDMTLEFNWQTVTVFILLIVLIAVIGGRFYAFAKLETIHTVDHIATNGKTICVHHNDNLYLLTENGQLQKTIALADFGLNSSPADIELLNDGSLLIGDSQTKSISKCDVSVMYCDVIAPSSGISINDNYKFFADEQNNILYISDTNNHRLIAHDLLRGSSEILKNVKLKYPNDLTVNKDGIVYITDTKNSRVVSFERVNDFAKAETKNQAYLVDLEIYQEPKATHQKLYPEPDSTNKGAEYKKAEAISEKVIVGAVSNYPSPLALAQASNKNWWVIVADAYINYGELWIFDILGELVKDISLSEISIPLDIVSLEERILVTDTEENQVFSLNTQATRIELFGDESFQTILLETRENRDFYRAIKNHSFRVLGVLLLSFLLMLFAVKQKQKKTGQA